MSDNSLAVSSGLDAIAVFTEWMILSGPAGAAPCCSLSSLKILAKTSHRGRVHLLSPSVLWCLLCFFLKLKQLQFLYAWRNCTLIFHATLFDSVCVIVRVLLNSNIFRSSQALAESFLRHFFSCSAATAHCQTRDSSATAGPSRTSDPALWVPDPIWQWCGTSRVDRPGGTLRALASPSH